MIEEKARILENRQIIPGAYLLKLEAPKSSRYAQPGQFAMIKVTSNNGCILRRPISIHRAEGNDLFFLYSVIGKGTNFLSQQIKGQSLSILAPLGNGYHLPDSKTEVLLIAGGRGIAPLIFLAERALEKGIQPTLLLGARSADCLYPAAYLPPGIDIDIATEDGTSGFKGQITDLFLSRIRGKSHVYACGPIDMYKTMKDLLDSWQEPHKGEKPEVQVSLEARMACGIGACYGCTVKTNSGLRKVCSDGPVFNLDELISEEVKI